MEQTSAQPTEIGTFLFSYDCEKGSVRCPNSLAQKASFRQSLKNWLLWIARRPAS